MKYVIRILFLTLGMFTAMQASASSDDRFGLGVRLQLSNWKGDNNGSSPDFDAKANQLALTFRYQLRRFYAGLSLQAGSFKFSNGAPQMNNKIISVAPASATVDRGESDLLAGYYFWPQVSLFLDLKSITNSWRDLSYSAKYTGLGLGVAGIMPMRNNWALYASFGVVPLKIEAGGDNIGHGSGGSLEIGATYRANTHNTLSIGIKSQTQTYNFDNGSKQTHNLGGLTLGYSYNF